MQDSFAFKQLQHDGDDRGGLDGGGRAVMGVEEERGYLCIFDEREKEGGEGSVARRRRVRLGTGKETERAEEKEQRGRRE